MAERRLKAVVADEDNEMGVGIEGVGETEKLELSLSLGQWECRGGSLSQGSTSCGLSPCDPNIGSSSYSNDLAVGSRLEQNDGEKCAGEMEGVELDGPDFHATGFHLTERVCSDDMDKDAQYKRAKLLFDEEQVPCHENLLTFLPSRLICL